MVLWFVVAVTLCFRQGKTEFRLLLIDPIPEHQSWTSLILCLNSFKKLSENSECLLLKGFFLTGKVVVTLEIFLTKPNSLTSLFFFSFFFFSPGV